MVFVSNEECDIVDKFKDVEEGRYFEVVTYFAAQFYALRRSYLDEETEEDYIQSLVQSRPWRTSGGKSSAQFSKTLMEDLLLNVLVRRVQYVSSPMCM